MDSERLTIFLLLLCPSESSINRTGAREREREREMKLWKGGSVSRSRRRSVRKRIVTNLSL
jgi:hypothetical protein